MYQYRAKVLRVVDGDTLHVDWDLGRRIHVDEERLRLLGLDAPDKDEPVKWANALQYASGWLAQHAPDGFILIETIPTSKLQAADKKEKFGGYLAKVWNLDRSVCLNDDLIASGNATAWDGKGPKP